MLAGLRGGPLSPQKQRLLTGTWSYLTPDHVSKQARARKLEMIWPHKLLGVGEAQ